MLEKLKFKLKLKLRKFQLVVQFESEVLVKLQRKKLKFYDKLEKLKVLEVVGVIEML